MIRVKEKVKNNPYILEVGRAKYLRVPMESKLPIGIIEEFDEHKLIVHVIQSLSLSTASLVYCLFTFIKFISQNLLYMRDFSPQFGHLSIDPEFWPQSTRHGHQS